MTDLYTIRWIAILSNGTTLKEYEGDYKIIPGQRLPWVRLCTFLEEQHLHLVGVEIECGDRLLYSPANSSRWYENSVAPNFYSLSYRVEASNVLGNIQDTALYVDLASHFDDFVVHCIQSASIKESHTWVVVTHGDIPLMPTPAR